jgi:hypothetical protein
VYFTVHGGRFKTLPESRQRRLILNSTVADATRVTLCAFFRALKYTAKFTKPLTRQRTDQQMT